MSVQIKHIGIFVKDIDATAAFYARVFGLRRVAEVDAPPQFNQRALNVTDDAGHAITLIQPGDVENYREWVYKTWGVNHIGFTVDDLDATLAQLKAEGVEGIECIEVEGQPIAKFRDMNGTEIDVADSRYLVWDMSR